MSKKPTWTELAREAKTRFGIRRIRPEQRHIVEAVLEGRDVLGILPTGAGKSLTYQLPAMFFDKQVIVVSPLIALMQDQQRKLEDAHVDVAKLDSTLTTTETAETIEEIRHGRSELVYVTPERLENPKYLEILKEQGASLFVVDEAHCVSQWGHDFRPAYLAVRDAVRALGSPPVLALTATAPPDVAKDIVVQLGMRDPTLVTMGIERENIFLEVQRTPSEDMKRIRLKELLAGAEGAGILYVATVRAAEEIYEWLKADGVRVARYHGKLTKRIREETQDAFMNDDVDLLVATNAFGLGIDKPNIRFVAHWNFPDSLESYYQEAGRGGRDGKPARAILLYRLEDRRIQSYFIGGKYPRREQLAQAYEALGTEATSVKALAERAGIPERRARVIVANLEASGVVEKKRGGVKKLREFASREELEHFLSAYEERRDDDRERLDAIMHYAQTTSCRMSVLKEHFGEAADEPCGHCDNCRDDPAHRLVEESDARERERHAAAG